MKNNLRIFKNYLIKCFQNPKPICWGFYYISLVLLFALIYTLPIFSFQHSALHLETEALENKQNIEKIVIEILEEHVESIRELTKGFKSDQDQGSKKEFNLDAESEIDKDLYLMSRKVEKNIRFEIFSVENNPNELNYIISYQYDLPSGFHNINDFDFGSINCIIPLSISPKNSEFAYSLKCLEFEIENIFINPSQTNYKGEGIFSFIGFLQDEEIQNTIHQYRNALNGNDSNFGFLDRFLRKFYLSAVTITTLGYGDITPINNISRFFIALECIFGIVFMGLFLNSLTKRDRN